MTVRSAAPCEPWTLPDQWCCDITGASPAVTGAAVQAATEVLWALSGRQFGLCTVTLRPCRRDCFGGVFPYGDWWNVAGQWPMPVLYQGAWFNLACGGCAGGCSCSSLEEFVLPSPVAEIISITIDDVAVPTGSYRIDDFNIVVRTDGGAWPICNDLSKNEGVGTWFVTARIGAEVPELGRQALGELACEFVKGCSGEPSCRLPSRLIQSLTRQGVTMQFVQPEEFLKAGLLGLWTSDLFIRTYNPSKLASRASIYSPDVDHSRMRT